MEQPAAERDLNLLLKGYNFLVANQLYDSYYQYDFHLDMKFSFFLPIVGLNYGSYIQTA